VTVVCGPSERDPSDANAITNPILIVEVLSPSTEEYDRGDKFEHYKRIPSLQQYVHVSHGERQIEVWSRAAHDEWTCVSGQAGSRLALKSINADLSVDDVYDFSAEPK
jgi:Uma2 family endonuclease